MKVAIDKSLFAPGLFVLAVTMAACAHQKVVPVDWGGQLEPGPSIRPPVQAPEPAEQPDLIRAVLTRNPYRVKLALERGGAVDQVDDNGATALHYAAALGFRKGVELLLEKGGDPLRRDKFGLTAWDCLPLEALGWQWVQPFASCTKSGRIISKEVPVSADMPPEGIPLDGPHKHRTAGRLPYFPRTAATLMITADVIVRYTLTDRGELKDLEFLKGHPMFNEVVADAVGSWRFDPGWVSTLETKISVQRFMFRLRRRPSVPLPKLHRAVIARDARKLDQLLYLGCSVESIDSSGATALHHAAAIGFRAGIENLIAKGADPLQRDYFGFTAWDYLPEEASDWPWARGWADKARAARVVNDTMHKIGDAKPGFAAPAIVKKARISGWEPDYPRFARAAGIEADVVVRFGITKQGRVGDFEFLTGHPCFNRVVARAIQTWHFDTGRPDLPAGAHTVYKFVFRLE